MKLTFYGGVGGEVSGANYLVESGGSKILVDCGLHQGSRYCEKLNFEPFPYKASEIGAVFVTHAHIDHTGRLPKLVKDGFRGIVYSTPPTRDFAELLLRDSEDILRKESEELKKRFIYSIEDIDRLMEQWKGIEYHEDIDAAPFKIRFYDAGHILGSAFIEVEVEGKKVVFSGDLGNYPAPIIEETEKVEGADYCLVESTYGNRVHEAPEERKNILEDLIEDTVKSGGVLLIPAFAMERTQELLYELNELAENGRIPKASIFVESPLAIKLTKVYRGYSRYFNPLAKELLEGGDELFNFTGLKKTLTVEESKAINDVPPPKVIIAGAGMSNGGRILHHERRYISDPKNTILFIGYQAKGSLGRLILDGEKTVRIFGEDIEVKCKIKAIGGYSAHADQPRLLEWLNPMRESLKKVFAVQGEEDQAAPLAQKIRDELAVEAVVPKIGEEAML